MKRKGDSTANSGGLSHLGLQDAPRLLCRNGPEDFSWTSVRLPFDFSSTFSAGELQFVSLVLGRLPRARQV